MNRPSTREDLLRLQRLLLPASLPVIACTEAGAAFRATNNELSLGGDWFDLIDRPESNSVVAIVGDVVGHGVEQIGIMGQLRAASNALAHVIDDPTHIVAGLDRFAVQVPGAQFASIAVVVFDGSSTVRICCAGHPPPLRIDGTGGVHVVNSGRRSLLTVGATEPTGTFTAHIGDLVVMYTDGVVERADVDIYESIRSLGHFVQDFFDEPCVSIAERIVDEFGTESTDDQAVLVLRPLHARGPKDAPHVRQASEVSWPSEQEATL